MKRNRSTQTDSNRRTFLGVGLSSVAGVHSVLSAASSNSLSEKLRVAPIFNEYRYGHMVQEYYVGRLRSISERRTLERNSIQTPEQVWHLKAEVRAKVAACYGQLPDRTPLKTKVTRRIEREQYVIEHLLFQSRPGYLVTANVYVPKGGPAKKPTVLGTCGHSSNGKAAESYQEFARNLAKQGYLVLIYDPPGQGERAEYRDQVGEPRVRGGTHSHNVVGNQMTLIGENFAKWEAWDGIRAVDYLLSRDDVDPLHLGVTGNSGGGTQTCHLTALEDRFTMAAPSCFVTRFLYNLENEEPTDSEQVIPGWLAAGLDMTDFFVAQLPRPTILIGQENDFFDVRGLRETFHELKRLYTILGFGDRVQLHVGANTHGYHRDGREAMYGFFNQQTGKPRNYSESNAAIEKDEVLQVTNSGHVYDLGSRKTYEFTAEVSSQLRSRRGVVGGKQLVDILTKRLAIPGRGQAPRYRGMRHRSIWNEPSTRDYGFIIETETPIRVMLHAIPRDGALYFFPKKKAATIYLPHRSSLKEMIGGQAVEIEQEDIRFALDVRGIGQMTARTHKDSGNNFFNPYGSDFMYANQGFLLNEPYCGRRVFDVLRVLDLFQSHGYEKIHLVGRGLGALTATFASLLHPLVKSVTLHNTLLSYFELTQDSRYQWPQSSMIYGALTEFDIPDCLQALHRSKKLKVVDPWTSQMEVAKATDVQSVLELFQLTDLDIQWSNV
jgi:dienelactone hydrolase